MFVGLSREKINHLSKEIIERLEANEEIGLLKPANDVRLRIVRVMTEEIRLEETIDASTTKRSSSAGVSSSALTDT